MPLTLVLGGARSGKSALAERLARRHEGAVVVIATAEPGDEEMAARIERHRRDRPAGWTTVEEPRDLPGAVADAPPTAALVVDCLTLWVSNVADLADADVLDVAERAAATAAGRPGPTIAVTNEVGSGIVPADAATRRYRDLLGTVNSRWAEAADRVLLTAAGRVVPLLRPEDVVDDLA